MPLYYFHVIDGEFLIDDIGTECADMDQVRSQAVQTAGEILTHHGNKLVGPGGWQMHVTDDAKKTVYKLIFSAFEVP